MSTDGRESDDDVAGSAADRGSRIGQPMATPDVAIARTISTAACLTRLRRIEGQVRGLQHMIDRGDACIDVLTQIKSVTAALDCVALGLLDQHIRDCVTRADDTGPGRVDEIVDDLMDAVARLRKT